jgi:type I restriction enzyme R subunit
MKSHLAEEGNRPFEIDILIVVNMFLTGFDAPTLNTLYLDKDLQMHGLIQALSRTNRILNSQKAHGEIVCFRNLRKNVDQALMLFGQEQAGEIVLLPGYDECRQAIVQAIERVEEIGDPYDVLDLQREDEKKEFVKAWTSFMRELNRINTFSQYTDEEIGEAKLAERIVQDYSSAYMDLYEKHVDSGDWEEFEIEEEPVVFDITLIQTIEVDISYILDLIGDMVDSKDDGEKQRILGEIESRIGASASLREKRELIFAFIEDLDLSDGKPENVYREFQRFVQKRAKRSIQAAADEYQLDYNKTVEFLEKCLAEKEFSAAGQAITGLATSNFSLPLGNERRQWKMDVEQVLENNYEELVNIVEKI